MTVSRTVCSDAALRCRDKPPRGSSPMWLERGCRRPDGECGRILGERNQPYEAEMNRWPWSGHSHIDSTCVWVVNWAER
jgi:hypothetical protein